MADIIPAATTKGLWKVISDTTLVANQTFIDFLNLDLNRDGEYILSATLFNNNVAATSYNLFVNGDLVDGNYYRNLIDGGAVISGNSGALISLALNEPFVAEIHIFNNPTGKPIQIYIASNPNAALNGLLFVMGSILCPAAANITSMRLNASNANALPIGSRFILSKIKS